MDPTQGSSGGQDMHQLLGELVGSGAGGQGGASHSEPELQQVAKLGDQISHSNQQAAQTSLQAQHQAISHSEQAQKNFAQTTISLQHQIVQSNEITAHKSVEAKKKEIQQKTALDLTYGALHSSVIAGIQAASQQSSTVISSGFTTLVGQVKSQSVNLGGIFKSMASQMGKAVISAIGDSVTQKGAAYLLQGTADLIALNPTGGTELVAGAMLSAAGGTIKGAAASFMAQGGLVTKPTLAMVGEGGQSEAVIPLDHLSKVGMGGGQVSIGSLETHFPNVQGASGKSSSRAQSPARTFLSVRQAANRRTGNRNS
jgi:hypothetical protein